MWCREGELNPHRAFALADFESAASASSAIPARGNNCLRKSNLRLTNSDRLHVLKITGASSGVSCFVLSTISIAQALNCRQFVLSGYHKDERPRPYRLQLSALGATCMLR